MLVRRGATRTVLLVGNVAIKVPRMSSWTSFLHGLLANMQEAYWWRMSRRFPHIDPQKRLCPILLSLPGGFLVVMRRAYLPKNYRRRFTHAYCRSLREMFDGLPFDAHPQNFGFVGRRLVMIDYGS